MQWLVAALTPLALVAGIFGSVILDAGDADASKLTQLGDNNNIAVQYNADTGVLTMMSTYADPLNQVVDDKGTLYDVNDHGKSVLLSNFVLTSNNTASVTLGTSDRGSLARSAQLGLYLSDGWATLVNQTDVVPVRASDETVTVTAKPPKVVSGSYNVTTNTATLEVSKDVEKVDANGVCVVVKMPILNDYVATLSTCATSVTISGNMISAKIDISCEGCSAPGMVPNDSTLEVWPNTLKGYVGGWNSEAFSKDL